MTIPQAVDIDVATLREAISDEYTIVAEDPRREAPQSGHDRGRRHVPQGHQERQQRGRDADREAHAQPFPRRAAGRRA